MSITRQASEKQTTWANQIKAAWMNQLSTVVTEAKGRIENDSMPQSWLDAVNDVIASMTKDLDNLTVRQIIDNRNWNVGSMASATACKLYDKRRAV